MKPILTLLVLANLALSALSADYAKGESSLYSISGANLRSATPLRGDLFSGIGCRYMLTKNIGVNAEVAVRDWRGPGVDQTAGHFVGYLPLFNTGLTAYGEIGYQHHFGGHVDYMSTGAGVEIRGKRAFAGAGARVLEDFRTGGKVQPVIFVGLHF